MMRPPLALYVAFGTFVVYAGRLTGGIAEALLVVLVLGLCRPWMALPNSLPSVLSFVLLAVVAIQVVFDVFTSDIALMRLVRGVAPIYYILFGFLIYAGLRQWEHSMSRVDIYLRIERAFLRCAPPLISVFFVVAILVMFDSKWAFRYPLAIPLRSTGQEVVVMAIFLFPVVQHALKISERALTWRLLILMLSFTTLIVVFRGRTAVLAIVAVLLFVKPHLKRIIGTALGVTALLLVLYISGLSVGVRDREISYDAAVTSIASVVGGVEGSGPLGAKYASTSEWRSNWWIAIVSDVWAEKMVLHGYGWDDHLGLRYPEAIMLYDHDGQPYVSELPHNVLLSLAGHGGLIVAGLFLATAALTVARVSRVCGRESRSFAIDAALCAVVGAAVVSLVEIGLDKPQVAALFWSLIGFLWWASAPPTQRLVDDEEVPIGALP